MSDQGWQQPAEDENFWAKAAKKEKPKVVKASAEAGGGPAGEFWSSDPVERTKKKHWLRRRVLWISVGGVALLFIILLMMVPTIGGWFVPGAIRSAAAGITGKVDVEGVSLSWGGPQKLGVITLSNDGKEIAKVEVSADVSLMSLIRGNYNLGDVVITGDVSLVRDGDGVMNIQKALKPVPNAPKSDGKPAVPASLIANLVIKDLNVAISDKTLGDGSRVRIKGLTGGAKVEVAKPVAFTLAGSIDAGEGQPRGAAKVDVKISKWSNDDGELTPKKTGIAATLTMEKTPGGLAETLAGAKGLSAAMGGVFELSAAAEWQDGAGGARIDIASEGARTSLEIVTRDGALALAREATLWCSPRMLRFASPDLATRLSSGEPLKLDALPGVAATLRKLTMPLPSGTDVEVGEAAIDLTVRTDAVAGSIKTDAAGPARAFTATPIEVTITSEKVSRRVSAKASGRATVNGQDAGVLAVDVGVGNLVGRYGNVTTKERTIEGTAELRGLATAIVQSLAGDVGVDLVRDLGPTLDVSVAASQAAGSSEQRVNIQAKGQKLVASAALALTPDEAAVVKPGAEIRLSGASGALAKFITPDTGWSVLPGGSTDVVVAVRSGSVPLSAGSAPLVTRVELDADVSVKGLTLQPVPAPGAARGESLRLNELKAQATLKPGAPVEAKFTGAGMMGLSPISLSGDARGRIENLMQAGPIRPRLVAAGLKGNLNLKGLPMTAAGSVAQLSAEMARALSAAVGEAADVACAFSASQTNIVVDASVKGPRAEAAVNATAADGKLRIGSLWAKGDLTPERFAALRDALSPGEALLTPLGEFGWTLSVEPMTMPVDDNLKPTPDADAKVTASGGLTTRSRWRVIRPGDSPRDLTVEPTRVSVVAAPSAVVGAGGRVDLTLTGSAKADTGQRFGNVNATASVTLAKGVPNGPVDVNIKINGLDSALVGAAIGDTKILDAVIGPEVDADVTLAAGVTPGAGGGSNVDRLEMTASVKGDRFTTESPLKLGVSRDTIGINSPAMFTLTPDPAWLTSRLGPTGPEKLRVNSIGAVNLKVSRLTMPARFEPGAGVLPRTLDVEMKVAGMVMNSAQQGDARLSGLIAQLNYTDPRQARVTITCDEAQVGARPPTRGVRLVAGIANAIDSMGRLTTGTADVSAEGDLPLLPTSLVDGALGFKGLLNEVLGPTASVKIAQARYNAANGNGTLDATLTSPRSVAEIRGRFDKLTLTTTGPMRFELKEVSPGLSAYLAGRQPVFAQVSKAETDKPLVFSATGMTAPLAGDLSALDGDFTLDLGEARVALAGTIARLLKPLVPDRAARAVSFSPLNFTIRKGVLTLPKWSFPLDTFTFHTQGAIDLAKREVDLLTWVPAGALTGETLGQFSNQLSGLTGKKFAAIDPNLYVPLRTKGPLDGPSTSVELNSQSMDELKRLAGKTLEDQLKSRILDQIKDRIPGLGQPAGAPGAAPPAGAPPAVPPAAPPAAPPAVPPPG